MNISNLKEGQVIKNYPELCKVLEIPKKTSNSKKAQMKELGRFVKFRQSGHSFIIDEVYDFPKDKVDNRGRKSLYGDIIQLLVMDYLIDSGKPVVTITRNSLMEYMKMINSNYKYCSKNVYILSEYTQIDREIIYDFFNTSKVNFKSTIETALDNLRDRSLITWNSDIMVQLASGEHELANEIQKEMILKCERAVLMKMGYEEMSHVAMNNKWEEFRYEVYKLLREYTDIKRYFSIYKIIVNRGYIEYSYDSMLSLTLDRVRREELKNELNATLCEQLVINAENRRKSWDGDSRKKYRIKFTYEEDNQKLVSMLINQEAENVIKNLDELKLKKLKATKNHKNKNDSLIQH